MRQSETEYINGICSTELRRALTTIAEQGFKHEAALLALALRLIAPHQPSIEPLPDRPF